MIKLKKGEWEMSNSNVTFNIDHLLKTNLMSDIYPKYIQKYTRWIIFSGSQVPWLNQSDVI